MAESGQNKRKRRRKFKKGVNSSKGKKSFKKRKKN